MSDLSRRVAKAVLAKCDFIRLDHLVDSLLVFKHRRDGGALMVEFTNWNGIFMWSSW